MNSDPINGNPNLTDLSFFFLCIMFFYLSPKFLFCALFLFTFLPLPIVPYHSLSDLVFALCNIKASLSIQGDFSHSKVCATHVESQKGSLFFASWPVKDPSTVHGDASASLGKALIKLRDKVISDFLELFGIDGEEILKLGDLLEQISGDVGHGTL